MNRPPVTLEEAFISAKSVWPRIRLSYEQFHDFVTQVQAVDGDVPAHCADIYLCTGCVHGHGAALRALAAAHFPSLRAVIYNVVREEAAVDDILQDICARLFAGTTPRLRTYRGSGSLGGWLRRVALRASQDYQRTRSAQDARLRRLANAEPECAPAPECDPDGEARASLCSRAVSHAVCSLSPVERQLLHHHFVSGLSIDTLGTMYSVHRATIARRINRATGRVRQNARKVLATHFPGLGEEDLDDLVRSSCRDSDLVTQLCRDPV